MVKKSLVALAVVVAAVGAASASTVIGMSLEDQARLSELVVVGEVVSIQGVEDPLQGIESAVTLRVSQVLKGSVSAGESVVFHIRSGQVGDEISTAIGEADLKPGQKTLVFIENIDGRLYNLGLSMGVLPVIEGRNGQISVARSLPADLQVVGGEVEMGPFSLKDVARRVAYAASHPEFDNELLRAARVE